MQVPAGSLSMNHGSQGGPAGSGMGVSPWW